MTPKQEAFVHHYCANGGNGTQAAIAAGYSENCAHVQATENLSKPYIRDAIETFKAKAAERAEVTIESLTEDLRSHMEKAIELGQSAAAIQATMGIAKLHGLLAEDRKNERSPLNEVLNRINRQNNGKPRLTAVK